MLTKSILRIRLPISIIVHVALILAANIGAFWLRFDGRIPEEYWQAAVAFLPWLLIVRMLVFWPVRLFEGLWKYTSIWDLRNIVVGVAVSTVILYPIEILLFSDLGYPRSILLIDSLLLVSLLGGARISRRVYRELRVPTHGRRVLIYGAGDAGELIVRDMRNNAKFQATAIGFVDDDYQKVGQRIHGVPVLGGRNKLPEILKRFAPDELLIAIPSTSPDTLRQIVRALEEYKIRITTLPRLHELVGARVDVSQIRQLKVEDLLRRDPVGLDDMPIRRLLEGKRVVVTGAGGTIGSELCRQIAAARPASLALLERYENSLFYIHNELARSTAGVELRPVVADVTDARRIHQVLAEVKPHIIFHAAAHKHVPLMEDNPCEAVKNNVRGTRIMAEAALLHGVQRFILISTDKAVNPTSVMGATKRIAEIIVSGLSRNHATRFASVRFGNVLGSNGSVVPTFLSQIAEGGPVTVTHPEMKRFFMLIPEAVQLVLHAGALADQAPLFVLEMGEQVKVVDLARDVIRLSGYVPDKDILIEFTGIRPGEKLFEELIGESEFAEPSSLDKILRVQAVRGTRLAELAPAIAKLEELAQDGRSGEVLIELQSIIAKSTAGRDTAVPI